MDNRSSKGQSAKGASRAGAAKGKPGGDTIKTAKTSKANERPGWAAGLRQLYDAVVDEPLPDSFSDLIAKLDSKN